MKTKAKSLCLQIAISPFCMHWRKEQSSKKFSKRDWSSKTRQEKHKQQQPINPNPQRNIKWKTASCCPQTSEQGGGELRCWLKTKLQLTTAEGVYKDAHVGFCILLLLFKAHMLSKHTHLIHRPDQSVCRLNYPSLHHKSNLFFYTYIFSTFCFYYLLTIPFDF